MDLSKEFCVASYLSAGHIDGMFDADMFCFLIGVSYPGYRTTEYQNSI